MREKAKRLLLSIPFLMGSLIAYTQDDFPQNLESSIPFWTDQVEFIHPSNAQSMLDTWMGVTETQLSNNQAEQLEKVLFLSRYWVAELEKDARQFLFKRRHLAVYLSGFNPSATDEKHDRAGIWMLTYPDARRYGLVVNESIDERRDIRKSTETAALLFKDLKERHGGNAETMFVLGTVGHGKTSPEKIDQVEQNLSAIRILTKGMETKETLTSTSKWTKQEIGLNIAISALIKEYKISEVEFRKMNPTLVGSQIPPNTLIWIPRLVDETLLASKTLDLSKQKKKSNDSLMAILKNNIPSPTSHKVVTYRVKSGDVLGRIAEHHGVSISKIKKWNDLRSDRIDINQKLTIYLKKGQKVPKKRITSATPKPKVELTSEEKAIFTIYEVQPGDTLWAISKQFEGVKPEEIMAWNNIGEDLSIGQKLKIKTH